MPEPRLPLAMSCRAVFFFAVLTWACSFRGITPVQHEAAPYGERAVVAGQEQRSASDLGRIGNPLDRGPCCLLGSRFRRVEAVVDLGLQQRSAGDARTKRVD